MDIRGFFGGKAAAKPAVSKDAAVSSSSSSSKVSETKENSSAANIIPKESPKKEQPVAQAPSSAAYPEIITSVADKIHLVVPNPLGNSIKNIITWKAGEKIPFASLVATFESIAAKSGRLEKEDLFANFFTACILTTPDDLECMIYLSSNSVAPQYEGMELGIGDSLLVKAVCEATGRNKVSVEEDYKREGDLGVVALNSRASQKTLSFAAKPKPLTASHVLEQFRLITKTKGEKAQGRKVDIIKAVMIKCLGEEAKYIVRGLQGKLRIGTASMTVLVSLAHAFARLQAAPSATDGALAKAFAAAGEEVEEVDTGIAMSDNDSADDVTGHNNGTSSEELDADSKLLKLIDSIMIKEPAEAKKLRLGKHSRDERDDLAVIAVKRAFSECPNYGMLCQSLLTAPLHQLYKTCRLVEGVPVSPMLAKPTKALQEVLKRLEGQAFTMEYKYDGERAQVHLLKDGSVKIFSRNSEDNSSKYPDLTEHIYRAKNTNIFSFVIDAEVVAYDREKQCLLPFQVLSTRKRKVEDGEEEDQKVKVVLQAFDMLYINGKSLLQESLRTRRQMLHSSFTENIGLFHFASGLDHVENGDTTPLETYLQEACAAMCEGLMVKTLDINASYEPSKRSLNWLKVKKDYIDGMGICDSVDLVVIGAYHGRGKRVNVFGAYLMACYDPDRDEYQSVCKVGTGFTDENLTRLTEKMTPFAADRRPYNYNVGDPLEPDVWFSPKVLWEIQAADLTASSVHKGGIGKIDHAGGIGKGIGLRFPRYLRDRDDKKPENATSAEQIAEIYLSQDVVNVDGGAKGDDDDDDDGI